MVERFGHGKKSCCVVDVDSYVTGRTAIAAAPFSTIFRIHVAVSSHFLFFTPPSPKESSQGVDRSPKTRHRQEQSFHPQSREKAPNGEILEKKRKRLRTTPSSVFSLLWLRTERHPRAISGMRRLPLSNVAGVGHRGRFSSQVRYYYQSSGAPVSPPSDRSPRCYSIFESLPTLSRLVGIPRSWRRSIRSLPSYFLPGWKIVHQSR
ncbi:hypothetical protein IE53DRAFT_183711 [Violaceomyces palustris]|uniref:Uncharacterized protein n=1 Tax=Violaceomyces palustris TaxID=1673888 RepID=A0ACD0P5K6_9BASI|nr:hypothetical protein IE53DRAFT_183711 [Violaceomyces palustris]